MYKDVNNVKNLNQKSSKFCLFQFLRVLIFDDLRNFRVDKCIVTDARYVYASSQVSSDVFFRWNHIHSNFKPQRVN